VSSGAFRAHVISVDIASRTTPLDSLRRQRNGRGVVSFSCGVARDLGFDAHDEPDPNFPDNIAHANMYSTHDNTSQAKTKARTLAEECTTEIAPGF
jgi:hypothetical protein